MKQSTRFFFLGITGTFVTAFNAGRGIGPTWFHVTVLIACFVALYRWDTLRRRERHERRHDAIVDRLIKG